MLRFTAHAHIYPQGQVNRAEVEETTFAIKRELAAIRQHDMDTNNKLQEARDRSVTVSRRAKKKQDLKRKGGHVVPIE
jgi:hypothetical protein